MINMELTEKQELGLTTAISRYYAGEDYTCIAGYAGSGKSTLVRFIISALDVEEVAYVAFTGKAAKVLAEKGNPNATTIHKLIYFSKQLPNGTFIYTPKPRSEIPYDIIVVDEVSMVPDSMWKQLLSYGIYIIACGDPGQLPPVSKEDANNVLNTPHVFLDEIMRQAQESEIIKFSMDIREGKRLNTFQGKEVQIINKSNLIDGMYSWADQILVATNNQRVQINNEIRSMCGRGEEPEIGDKIISLHNHWEIYSSKDAPLTNGTIGYITKIEKKKIWLPKYICSEPVEVLMIDMVDETGGQYSNLCADLKQFASGTPSLTPRQVYQLNKCKYYDGPIPMDFSYAYAVTTHKAQGSEWSKILLIEEAFPFDREEHKRWLYTGLTRASEKAVIVLK